MVRSLVLFRAACAGSVLAVISTTALADVTIGSLNTAGFLPSSGHRLLGQTFGVPAGESGIVSASLAVHNEGPAIDGVFHVYSFDSGAVTLSSLYSSAFTLPTGSLQTLELFPSLPVSTGTVYAIGIDWGANVAAAGGYFNTGYFADGVTLFQTDALLPFSGLDLAFEVKFGAVPGPSVLSTVLISAMTFRRRRP